MGTMNHSELDFTVPINWTQNQPGVRFCTKAPRWAQSCSTAPRAPETWPAAAGIWLTADWCVFNEILSGETCSLKKKTRWSPAKIACQNKLKKSMIIYGYSVEYSCCDTVMMSPILKIISMKTILISTIFPGVMGAICTNWTLTNWGTTLYSDVR